MYKGEKLNSITHLVAAALALGGGVTLVVFAAQTGQGSKVWASTIYAVCLLLSFLFSTLYHSFRGTPKRVFQRLDHIGIFLLIAGTYTPFAFVTLDGQGGLTVAAAVWGLSIFGITFKAVFGQRYNIVSTIFYLLCGWSIVLVWENLKMTFVGPGFDWLYAGGLVYSGGAIFYLLDGKYPRMHGIWHMFVMAGAACHFISIFFYVI